MIAHTKRADYSSSSESGDGIMRLEKIKDSVRISHKKLDQNIKDDIEAAFLDMERVGISPYKKDESNEIITENGEKKAKNMLIEKAVEFYCKAQVNFQGNGELYQKSYEALRDALSLSGEYSHEK